MPLAAYHRTVDAPDTPRGGRTPDAFRESTLRAKLPSVRTFAKAGMIPRDLAPDRDGRAATPRQICRNSGGGCLIRDNRSPAALFKGEIESRLGRFAAPTSIQNMFSGGTRPAWATKCPAFPSHKTETNYLIVIACEEGGDDVG